MSFVRTVKTCVALVAKGVREADRLETLTVIVEVRMGSAARMEGRREIFKVDNGDLMAEAVLTAPPQTAHQVATGNGHQ
jgi:hypothetical protein